jgi:hypothetical protein
LYFFHDNGEKGGKIEEILGRAGLLKRDYSLFKLSLPFD